MIHRSRGLRALGCVVCFVGSILNSLAAAPTTAVAKGDRINVRSRPGFSGEVITQLKKGQAVLVTGTFTLSKPATNEPPVWLRIRLPAESPVWVAAELVDLGSKTVKADVLNVRAGPSYDHASVARLKKGALLKSLGEVKDGWLPIAAPDDAVGFVPATLLATSGEKAPETPQAKPVPHTNAPPILVTNAIPAKPGLTLAPSATNKPVAAPTSGAVTSAAPASAQLPAAVAPSKPVATPMTHSPAPVAAPAPTSTSSATNAPAAAPKPVTPPTVPATAPGPTGAPATATTKSPGRDDAWFRQFTSTNQVAAAPVAQSVPAAATTPAMSPSPAVPAPAPGLGRTDSTPVVATASPVVREPADSVDESLSKRVEPRTKAKKSTRSRSAPPVLDSRKAAPVRRKAPEIPAGLLDPNARRVRREGLVVRPFDVQSPSFYALEARDTGRTINFLVTTRPEPLNFNEYRGKVVIVSGREYLDRRPIWRGVPLLNVDTIEAVR